MNTRKCPICSDWIADDEPMARQQVLYRQGRKQRARHDPVCLPCLSGDAGYIESADGRISVYVSRGAIEGEPVACATCGLPTHLTPDPRRRVPTCSDLCRSRQYSQRRSVATNVTHTCDGCGQGMTGRADRRYCSPACRQRAYRRRGQLVRFGVAHDDAQLVDTLGRLDSDAFEAVLERARQDDNLSAQHLAELARDALRKP